MKNRRAAETAKPFDFPFSSGSEANPFPIPVETRLAKGTFLLRLRTEIARNQLPICLTIEDNRVGQLLLRFELSHSLL